MVSRQAHLDASEQEVYHPLLTNITLIAHRKLHCSDVNIPDTITLRETFSVTVS